MCKLSRYANYRRFLRAALVATLAISSNALQASILPGEDKLQFNGFLSQGYFLSSENELYGNSSSKRGSLELTEIGLNFSYRPLSNLTFAAQGIYRRAGQVSDKARIDYALLDWRFLDQPDYQAGIRFGRVKNPLGFYNETRDVSFTRPTIFLPLGIYHERSRNLFVSTDGVQLYSEIFTTFGDLSFQLNWGELDDDLDEIEAAVLLTDRPGVFDSDPAPIGKVEYVTPSGNTRVAFSFADVHMDYSPGLGDFLAAGHTKFHMKLFSVQHSWEKLTLTGEYMESKNTFSDFGPFFPSRKVTSESYYLQAEYEIARDYQLIVRYDAYFNNKEDRDGEKASLASGFPSHNFYTKDQMIGLRWTPASNWMIDVEYHRLDGVSALSNADNPDRFMLKQHWDLLALQLSYRF